MIIENKKLNLKTSHTEVLTERTVDLTTGEIIENNTTRKKHTYLAGKEQFYLMYSSFMQVLKTSKDLKIKVYAYLLESYNAGVDFQIGRPVKKKIAELYDVSESAISNTLTELKKDNFIYSPERGLYRLNPRYAFKGSSKRRAEELKIIIELGCKDC